MFLLLGWYQITKAYYERYRLPVMHTKTNHFDLDMAPKWLNKHWLNILRMRQDGVPALGFTWYSLIDQIDWDTQLVSSTTGLTAAAYMIWTASPGRLLRPIKLY